VDGKIYVTTAAFTKGQGGAVDVFDTEGNFLHRLSPHLSVGRLTAELIQDLVYADKESRALVLAELNEAERNWFLAELPRAEAELRREHGKRRTD
jgi:hypothetical protein